MILYVSNIHSVLKTRVVTLCVSVAGGSSLKFPSSIQSDSEWTPLSPISVYSPSVTNGTKKPPVITNNNNNNVSSVIGFWNNKQ